MSTEEAWTINRLLTWTADYFKKQNIEQPRLEVEVLLGYALGCERIQLYTRFGEVVTDEQRAKFREFVKQRVQSMPVAYIVGKKEFYSLNFTVTRDTLIPRPETEHLVMAVLDAIKATPELAPHHVADVGTGSGIVAIAIAKHAKSSTVLAIDKSPAAVEIARQNAASLGVDARVKTCVGDLLSGIDPAEQFFAIAANLPYVSDSEFEQLDKTVKDFEPTSALVAGPIGTELIAKLIPQAAAQLVSGGLLALELSPMIADRVVDLVASDGNFEPAYVIKDLAGHKRIVAAKRK
ncbi:Release factor glutamine methyltransferase [Anatilimnocola aggregata]|uniref:Release factor glutamine methyltransferase n=1 Tax=Anatilimnocola aggregata TaxID=2528021 RepID=A0A517YF17_9BACT|nr:peptide chain release factor N(5)-glutamine methyltransferase [Anatilimnocola aggregata]QDU28742.1 Release factor glutamine methyltransferase [Anatilimnocola aggregata]